MDDTWIVQIDDRLDELSGYVYFMSDAESVPKKVDILLQWWVILLHKEIFQIFSILAVVLD